MPKRMAGRRLGDAGQADAHGERALDHGLVEVMTTAVARLRVHVEYSWGAVVLPRLKHRFEKGPLDWSAPPELPPGAASLRVSLRPD